MHTIACDLLPPLACACFPPFEQLIGQQMVQLQDSILERLHHHTLSSMLPDKTFEAHHAWILLCSSSKVGTWLVARLVFLAFWLFSLIFYTTLCTWLGLPHPSIVSIPRCVHPINLMGIHLLLCAHGNEHIRTHDAICDTFAAITQDVSFHMGREQLHALPSTTFNSFCWRVDIVFTKDDIRTLADVVIVDPSHMDLFSQSCATQRFVTLHPNQAKEMS